MSHSNESLKNCIQDRELRDLIKILPISLEGTWSNRFLQLEEREKAFNKYIRKKFRAKVVDAEQYLRGNWRYRKAMRGNYTDEPIISLAYFPQLGSLTNNDENQSWVFS